MIGKIDKEELLDSVTKLPVLSEVVYRAMKLIDDPQCSIRDLTDLISKDQSISAKVMKIANSAFYGFPRKIHSLSEAFIILGFRTIRSLLITASVSDLLRGPVDGYIITKGDLWKHSYAVAFTAGNVARSVKKQLLDASFTAGILHDIGKLILGNYLKGTYQEVLSTARNTNITLPEAEEKLLGYNHAVVGGMVLDHWNFPEVIVNAVSNHHKPLSNGNDEYDPMTGILHVADGWVLEKGIGIVQQENLYKMDTLILQKMGISDETRDDIFKRLDSELVSMHEIFNSDKAGVKLSVMPDVANRKKGIKAF